jgi:hypothetical protein
MEKNSQHKAEESLADLIAAAGRIAYEFSDNDKDGYKFAQIALVEILCRSSRNSDANKVLEDLSPPSQLFH